jgi:hypothetical protein
MRTALLGGTTLAVVAIAAILLWGGAGGGRLPAPLPAEPPSSSFVIHDAAPAPAGAPAPAPEAAQPSSLDALMQQMRTGSGGTTVEVTPSSNPSNPPSTSAPSAPSTPATAPTPAVPPASTTTASAVPAPVAPGGPTPLLPIAMQWTNVTSQGVRWRFGRGAHGFLLSIDLGGGQVADVYVQPAFQNLGVEAVNTRVDFLKATILQNFSAQSATYSFARDGSVSVDR